MNASKPQDLTAGLPPEAPTLADIEQAAARIRPYAHLTRAHHSP
jgi:hypothetical protein